jgi:hypothetical protein
MNSQRTLLDAKGRARKRSRDAGAIIFIVAMTLAVLASLGLYALTAATTEVKTSGYERQSAQTHYMADYGTLLVAHHLKGRSAEPFLIQQTPRPTNCASVPAPSATGYTSQASICNVITKSDLSLSSNWSVAILRPTTATTPGSLGYAALDGDFTVEVTTPTIAPPPKGYSIEPMKGPCFKQLTLTTYGQTLPTGATGGATLYRGLGQEIQRARIIAGPINRCP